MSTNNAALNRLLDLQNFLNTIGGCCGMAILNDKFRINQWTIACMVTVVIYATINMYTVYHFSGDIPKQLQTVCINGLLITGIQKLGITVRRFPEIQMLYKQLLDIFQQNQCGKRQKLLLKSVTETWNVTRSIGILTLVATITYGFWPFYMIVRHGEFELFMCTVIPMVDYTTFYGYAVTSLAQAVFAFYGITGNLAYDVVILVLVHSHRSVVSLLGDSLAELGDMWMLQSQDEQYRKAYLRNVLIAFQEINNYINAINLLSHPVIICQIACISLSMVICLFVIVVNNWVGGIGAMLFLMALFMSMCFMGTILQTSNQELCDKIYAANWYHLPIEDQRMILLLLLKTQNSIELWIGPLVPLNVESGLVVLKAIYQLFMMMLEFI